jgi:hypothetical protein
MSRPKYQRISIPRGATIIVLAQESAVETVSQAQATVEKPAKRRRRARQSNVSRDDFIKAWNASKNRQEVMQKTGMTYGAVSVRAHKLKGTGALKPMERKNAVKSQAVGA